MLQRTVARVGPRFIRIVLRADTERESAYDRESAMGSLSKGLDDALKYTWILVD